MLHIKHKYKTKKGRQHHHTRQFKADEKLFPNAALLEGRLNNLASRHRIRTKARRKLFGFFDF
jgi:hypothetical protein